MELRHWRYFGAAAEALSFAKSVQSSGLLSFVRGAGVKSRANSRTKNWLRSAARQWAPDFCASTGLDKLFGPVRHRCAILLLPTHRPNARH